MWKMAVMAWPNMRSYFASLVVALQDEKVEYSRAMLVSQLEGILPVVELQELVICVNCDI
jgi:hypothetical protein